MDGPLDGEIVTPLDRDDARRAGWSGSLRGPLRPAGAPYPDSVADAIASLVPAARTVEVEPKRGALRSLARWAVTGMRDAVDVSVDDGSGLDSFVIRYPSRDGLLLEEVCRVVDVAAGMRTRFGAALAHTRVISIDESSHGFRSGQVAGEAMPTLGNVHLNAAMFLRGEAPRLARPREERLQRASHTPPTQPFAVVTQADLVAAHELWHQVELGFQARDHDRSLEFRRELGGYFGVEVIDRAMLDDGARRRLVAEVSAYAATKPLEATAELASQWWCGRRSPAVEHFAAVVSRYFPVNAAQR